MLPIYRQTNQNAESPTEQIDSRTSLSSLPKAHAGLWFERFFNQYNNEFTVDPTSKSQFLQTYFSDKSNVHGCGDSVSIEHFTLRQQSLVAAQQGRTVSMQSTWHFATGLGNPHPLENALQWHPVLGTPYLPASGVKGVLRSWLELHDLPAEAMLIIFGSESKDATLTNGTQQAGELLFFDALPAKRVMLIKDTMTPHMGKWYEQGADSPGIDPTLPADWHAPVPIPFLVAKDLLLQFSIAPRTDIANGDALVDFALKALKDALVHIGAGAKTAAGYGHMQELDEDNRKTITKLYERISDAKLEAKEKAIKASLSPSQQVILELKTQSTVPDNQTPNKGGEFHSRITDALTEAADWPADDQKELAIFARDFFSKKNKYCSDKRRKLATPLIEKLLASQ